MLNKMKKIKKIADKTKEKYKEKDELLDVESDNGEELEEDFDKVEDNYKSSTKGSSEGSTLSTTIKYTFISGIVIGVIVIIVCVVMSIITMFSTITGTSVQIIDGSIISYGEPSPKPDKDRDKNINSNVGFDGDELYTKSKMIVEAVKNKPSLKNKVDKVKVPSGIPSIVRSFGGNRGGIYNYIEMEYIMREATKTDKLKDFNVDGTKISNNGLEFVMWAGTMQENGWASSYENYWSENKNWSEAHIIEASGGSPGPFQFNKWYFAENTYTLFVTSIENPSAGEYGLAGLKSKINKDKLKFNKNTRYDASEGTFTTSGKTPYWHFSDLVATSMNHNSDVFKGYAKEYVKILKNAGIDITATNSRGLTGLFWDATQRGQAFQCYHVKASGNKMSSQSGVTGATVLEMMAEGMFDDIEKWVPKLNTSDYNTWFKEFEKSNGLLETLKKNNKLGSGIDFKSRFQNYSDPTMQGTQYSSYDIRERKEGTLHKIIESYRIELEIRALVDAAFDKLGLTLPTNSGTIKLKESKGEFQAFWTNKSGKTLTSDQMRSYNAGAYSHKYLEFVGKKEKDNLSDTGKYKVDSFSGLFSDNIGIIHYRQGVNGDQAYNVIHQNPNDSSSTLSSSFCGGFSTSIVLSTYLHKYVHPCEIAYALNTYNQRHNSSGDMFSGGKCTTLSQAKLINEQMINGKKLFNAEGGQYTDENKLKECLKKGGMVITRVDKQSGLTTGGHFIVIRELTSNGRYLIANSTSNEGITVKKRDHEFKLSELYVDKNGAQTCYITPTSYYKKYLSSINTISESSSETGDVNYSGYTGKSKYIKDLLKDVFPNGVKSTADKAVAEGLSWVSYGKYDWGGSNPLSPGIDCSHFIVFCYDKAGKKLNYKSTGDLCNSGYPEANNNKISTTDKSKWKVGDVLVWNGHVTIYCGKVNGKHMMVHASTSKADQVIDSVSNVANGIPTQIKFSDVDLYIKDKKKNPSKVIRIVK